MNNNNLWNQDSTLTTAIENKLNSVLNEFSIEISSVSKKEIEVDVGMTGYKKFIYIGRYANTSEATINVTIHPEFCSHIDSVLEERNIKIGSLRQSKLGRLSLSSNYKKFPVNKSSTQRMGAKYRVPMNDGLNGLKILLSKILHSK
jgi:hypothetical protein